MTDTAPEEKPGGNPLTDTLLGQAAAGITIVAAFIYGAGAMTVALRLYFTHLPWASIVGQMPHDLIITTGFGQVVLPAAIIGVLGAILLNFLVNPVHPKEPYRRTPTDVLRHRDPREGTRDTLAGHAQSLLRRYMQAPPSLSHFGVWLCTSLLLGAAEALIALIPYHRHRSGYIHPSVVISELNFFIVVGLISAVAVGIAVIMLPFPRPLEVSSQGGSAAPAGTTPQPSQPPAGTPPQPSQPPVGTPPHPGTGLGNARESKLSGWQWHALVGACIAFAIIPGAAAISASTLFPLTLACSPAFHNGALSGNLIATNGPWAYLVEYRSDDYSHDFFSVVPLSSVHLMTIGKYGDCGELIPPSAPKPTARPAPTQAASPPDDS